MQNITAVEQLRETAQLKEWVIKVMIAIYKVGPLLREFLVAPSVTEGE